MVLNECDVDVEAVDMVKINTTNKHGFLNKCDEINKRDKINKCDEISFISNIICSGSNDDKMEEEKFNIVEKYKPTMKFVLRHNKSDTSNSLLFDINMIKSEPNKYLKELDSLETVNKLFKFGNLNNIRIIPFKRNKLNPLHNNTCESRSLSKLVFERDEKIVPNEDAFKTGYLSLDYDNIGSNYSEFYSETINIIYSNIKRQFMYLCQDLPTYDDTNTKVIGLLYSGGKDSTCRLLELLEQGECVVPIVNTFNSHDSTELLIRDIATVYNLSKIYKTGNFKGTLYKPKFLTYLSWSFDFDHVGLSQQPYNMMSLTALGKTFLNNCKRIECCLINGDIGVSYISEMTKLYKIAIKFNYNVANGEVKSIPPIVFPYIKLIKDDIIDNLDIRLDNIFNDKEMYTIIPTCQEITVRSIKIAFSEHKYWLYISFENCGRCTYCKTHSNPYYYTLCIPLVEAEPINEDDIVLSREQICSINYRFSNIFRAY